VDEKGLGGIEHEYDNVIRGQGEKIVVMADAKQRWFDGGEAQRDRGTSVVLALDEKVQYIADAMAGSDREDPRRRWHRSSCRTRIPGRSGIGQLAQIQP